MLHTQTWRYWPAITLMLVLQTDCSRAALSRAMGMYGLTHSELFWERKSDCKMLLAYNKRMAICAFRGTASVKNALADMQARRVAPSHAPSKSCISLQEPMQHASDLACTALARPILHPLTGALHLQAQLALAPLTCVPECKTLTSLTLAGMAHSAPPPQGPHGPQPAPCAQWFPGLLAVQ